MLLARCGRIICASTSTSSYSYSVVLTQHQSLSAPNLRFFSTTTTTTTITKTAKQDQQQIIAPTERTSPSKKKKRPKNNNKETVSKASSQFWEFYLQQHQSQNAANTTTTRTTIGTTTAEAAAKAVWKQQQQKRQQPLLQSQQQQDDDENKKSRKYMSKFWRDKRNQELFLEWAAKQLGLKELDDWYQVSDGDIKALGGSGLIHRRSLQWTLYSVYPDHKWLPWKFRSTPMGFWEDTANHRIFIEWAARQLNIRTLDDWYEITHAQIAQLGGSRLLNGYYNNSLARALSVLYPEHEWLPWRFRVAPRHFWEDTANHKLFMDWAARQLRIRTLDDWYGVTYDQVVELGGARLLEGYYNFSLQQALASVYPEHEWLPWKFRQVPRGFWDNAANHRMYMDWAARQLGIQQLDDWYTIRNPAKEIEKLGGLGLIHNYYNNSLPQALSAIYPEHEWLPWRFPHYVNHEFWHDMSNQRRFFDWAAKQLGFSGGPDEGWYTISNDVLYSLGGRGLLDHHRGSLIRALSAVYPEHQWDPWRFQRCSIGQNELVDEQTLRRYVEGTLAPQFHVKKLDDWYRVSLSAVSRAVGYQTVVARHGGLMAVLSRLYPEHEWDEHKMKSKDKRSSQRALLQAIQQLLPGEEVIEEYLHPGLRFYDSATAVMTLDIWVPSLSLALEYQGEHHYRDIYFLGNNPTKQNQRDQEKAEACARAGITLVAIPYWWSRTSSVEDLAATILAALKRESGIDNNDNNRTEDFLESTHPTLTDAARRGNVILNTTPHSSSFSSSSDNNISTTITTATATATTKESASSAR